MDCPACHHTPPPGSRFCNRCGGALDAPCTRCGHVVPTGSLFCNACGLRLASAPDATPPGETRTAEAPLPRDPRAYTPSHLARRILTSRAALEGERKHVTVLFADLADSTALAQQLDPEEMHMLMDGCFHRILEQVHRYEGTVNQFTGDGVMALFGAPIALEDAPRRAVVAALGIQRALEPLRRDVAQRHGADFRMRIGIHSGTVVVGKIGDDLRMDYTAMGDTTNLADRLQKLAGPGTVLISEATEHLVHGFFELRDLGAVGLKGIAGPVHAFEVTGERPVSGRIEAVADSGLTPLVGRERELETLQAAFESTRRGQGRVVFLVGEAGIGKSRLLFEFRRRLEGEPHLWFEGRCASFGRDTPFHAVADALRRRIGINEHDDDATALEKLEQVEEEEGGNLGWTLPFVRQMLSLPPGDESVAQMDAGTRRSETFRALQARALRFARGAPVVAVFEDLHWIDAASEEFVAFTADWVATTRMLLIVTYRPGYRHPFGDRSNHVRIGLEALSDQEMSSMVGSILAGGMLPEPLWRLIGQKAEGNPFFVEEVTHSLLEQGAIRIRDGRVELARPIEDLSVPDRIQDVLMARIDRLAEEPRRAIQIASIIGREFALRLLERLAEVGDRMSDVVSELRGLELIHEKALHPELAFMFKHALTHEVAYQSVLVQRRKALHAVVGRAIEELYRDRLAEHYEALAHHFDLAEDWEKSLHYHTEAGHKATQAYANHTAMEHFRQALAAGDRLSEEHLPRKGRRRLEEELGRAAFCVSDFAASGEAFLRASEAAEDPRSSALNEARASYSLLWAHDYERADTHACAALEQGRRHGDDAATALALVAQAEHASVIGRAIDSRVVEEAAELAKRSGCAEARVHTLIHLGQFTEWCGGFRRAVGYCEEGMELARREGLYQLLAFPQWFLGKALCGLGDYGRAIALLQEGVEVCDRMGDRALKTRLLNTLGWCFAEFGCHDRAADYNREATAFAREMVEMELVPGAPELYSNAAINLACNHIARGELDSAQALLEPLEQEHDDDPWMRWRYTLHVRDARARLALARGEPERALAETATELEGAGRSGACKLEARALELRGRVLLTMDARTEAADALNEALRLARAIEYPPVVWRASSLLGELARRAGRGDEAKQHEATASHLVRHLSQSLPQTQWAETFRAMGERMIEAPLNAYR